MARNGVPRSTLRLLRATDGTVSGIDLPGRKLLEKIKTPRPLAGIAISADGRGR